MERRRTVRGWGGACVVALATLSACNRASEPAADGDATSGPAPAPAEAPDEDEPIIEEPAEPVAGTRMIEPGKRSPTELRYAPSVGSARRLVVTVRVNTRRGDTPAPLSPRARFELDTTVTSAGESWRRDFAIVGAGILPEEGVAPEAAEAAEARLAAFVGHKGHLEITAQGQVNAWGFDLDPGSDVDNAIVLAGLRTALEEHLVALPAEAVGDGGSWEVTSRTLVQGVETWRVLRTGLRAREGNEIAVRADVSFPAGELKGQPVGLDPLAELKTWEGKGEITARIDVVKAVPIETHVALEASFTGVDAAGAAVSGKFGVDATVDEDYMSQRDHRVTLRGALSQGALVRGKVEPGTRVWFEKRRVKVSAAGDFMIAFERDARHRALLSFAFGEAPPERHVIHIARRQFEPERIDGLPPEVVDLDAKTRTALARANRRIEKIRNKVSDGLDFVQDFAWPLRGKITSTYGLPRVLNGEDHGIHWGVDLAVPVGKKVKAPAAGVVVFAEDDVPLSGTLLIIDHGHGLTSSFLHLKSIKVAVGDRVKKGQVVALSGNSGRSTGPHLDWRMNLGDVRVDPQLIVGKR